MFYHYLMTGAENDAVVFSSTSAIVVVMVVLVVNLVLWLYYKDQPKTDQGFCFTYYRLSYRRRFKRDLWGMPFFIILLFLIREQISTWLSGTGLIVVFIILLLLIIQPIYNYKKWKKYVT